MKSILLFSATPVAPVTPGSPVAPVAPVSPVAPVGPVTLVGETISSCTITRFALTGTKWLRTAVPSPI
ncbi:hypothetical protein D3C76_1696830 [compost metagenome]